MKPNNPFLISGYYNPEFFCDRVQESRAILSVRCACWKPLPARGCQRGFGRRFYRCLQTPGGKWRKCSV